MSTVNGSWLQPLLDALRSGATWPAKLGITLVVLFALWAVRRLAVGVVSLGSVDPQSSYRWRKITAWSAGTLGFFLVAFIWLDQVRSLSTFLGLLSAGLAIALKDFVSSLAGWLYIVVRAPFDVGDRVEIDGIRGDVIDVRLFKFTVMEIGNWVDADQSTGRIVHLPNSLVMTSPLHNYSRGFRYIWQEIPILVTFESDWERARELLLEIGQTESESFAAEAKETLKMAAKRYYLHFNHLTPIVYTRIEAAGVLLTLRHICPPRRRRGIESAITERILRCFREESEIDLAYPTTRFYDHTTEGKPDLRSQS